MPRTSSLADLPYDRWIMATLGEAEHDWVMICVTRTRRGSVYVTPSGAYGWAGEIRWWCEMPDVPPEGETGVPMVFGAHVDVDSNGPIVLTKEYGRRWLHVPFSGGLRQYPVDSATVRDACKEVGIQTFPGSLLDGSALDNAVLCRIGTRRVLHLNEWGTWTATDVPETCETTAEAVRWLLRKETP